LGYNQTVLKVFSGLSSQCRDGAKKFLRAVKIMRMVIQRVSGASVSVNGEVAGRIGRGLLVYLGVGRGDGDVDAAFLADKLVNLRIFADPQGKMNLSVQDIGGQILIISNFTLYGDCRKGRRPGFDEACEPENANRLFEKTVELVSQSGIPVEKGVFGANMQVQSVNDGPVTFLLDSERMF
jgi:D-aminoacyl-tRNA deacylase